MTSADTLITKLTVLAKIDAMLGNITAEFARLESEKKARLDSLTKISGAKDQLAKILEERRYRYQKEEKALKEERQKITDRKIALNTLNSKKLIEAAEREVESSTRLLDAREDALLKLLDEVEKLEGEFTLTRDRVTAEQNSFESFRVEAEETAKTLHERRAMREEERKAATHGIAPDSLSIYERVRSRYPNDAVVSVKGGSCSGCYMQVAPQLQVQLSKGDTLVKCRGCGRILAPEEASGAGNAQAH